jgi:hypothetical protein
MIWLFKIDEVFWNNKPKVNEFYTFDVDDIHFGITEYDISLYFGLADYFLLSDSNEDDVYQLRLESINGNPTRVIIPKNTEMYSIIKEFYTDNNNPR